MHTWNGNKYPYPTLRQHTVEWGLPFHLDLIVQTGRKVNSFRILSNAIWLLLCDARWQMLHNARLHGNTVMFSTFFSAFSHRMYVKKCGSYLVTENLASCERSSILFVAQALLGCEIPWHLKWFESISSLGVLLFLCKIASVARSLIYWLPKNVAQYKSIQWPHDH
jgi:hypothetical protein